jgi:hypothetical protein
LLSKVRYGELLANRPMNIILSGRTSVRQPLKAGNNFSFIGRSGVQDAEVMLFR